MAAATAVVPGCGGSDVRVSGWKVFATRDYPTGAVVEVSPGLVLPRSGYAGTELASFVLPLATATASHAEQGERALLLLGKGSLYLLPRPSAQGFHSEKTGNIVDIMPNLQAEWWSPYSAGSS